MRFSKFSILLIFTCCTSLLLFHYHIPKVDHGRRKSIGIRQKQEQHTPKPATRLLLAPETVLHLPSAPGSDPLVLLGFPFLHELDILHLKMQLLSRAVDYFVISEACYTQRGHRKPLFFNLSKHESRFDQFSRKIWHIIDCRTPKSTDEALGWTQTDQVKYNIGLALLAHPALHNNSKVVIGDSDEVSPNLQKLQTNMLNSDAFP